ncbi:hypothetical protein OIU85_004706 [Salix viminalis]|uniref:Uncharacterized protein n=1 Tax=Salix viminalis TaxID=40686 RepID=A0A9Q0PTE4_SALVM|nr:hypothetical protein OIU85_004706 [Salix viminalis]
MDYPNIQSWERYERNRATTREELVGNNETHNREGYNMALLKVELPKFHGENPQGWIRKSRKFSKLLFTPVHQWWPYLHLEVMEKVWFEGLLVEITILLVN